MIVRLWRGWTAPENTAAYERLLTEQIAPAILGRSVPGLRDLTVLRRVPAELGPTTGGETLTVMRFDDLAAVTAFTGGEPSASVVPPAARRLLARFEEHSQHYTRLAAFPDEP